MSGYGLNRYSFLGRIGSIRVVDNVDKPFTSVSVAIDESYTPEGGQKVERTKWVEVIVGGVNQAALFSPGRSVVCEGVPSAEAYINDNKELVATLKLKRATVTFADKKPE